MSRKAVPEILRPFVAPSLLVLLMAVLHLLGLAGIIASSDRWGNIPRSFDQPWGFLLFHLRHGNWAHWFANAVPLILLSGLARMMVPHATLRTWVLMPIVSGMLLWVWGRSGAHIGASALTYGWFFFLLAMAIMRRDRATLAGMLVAVILFGSMVWVFMAPAGVSWEGHVAGAVAGVLSALLWRRVDPMPKPIFLDEPEEEVEDLSIYATHRPKQPWEL
jgi:membrane associated rhomboid family serine protease